jgi:PAS domain S-box-containing protein
VKKRSADSQNRSGALLTEIGGRQLAEEAIRTSEQRLQDILDNTPAVVFVKDLELRYILVNREYERRYQVKRDQIRGKTDFDIHHHDVAEAVRANDRHVIEVGTPIQFEEAVPMAEGERQHVVVKFLLRDRTAKPYAVCGIATDITELKRAEELQARRARQAALHADIHAAFSSGTESALQTELQHSAEAVVRHLDAAFARIWTLNDRQGMLELQASAGLYTRLDGEHACVPVGKLKIGLIAQERRPHLTNDLLNDSRISHPDWATQERMVSFAGYPLLVEGRLVGVLAMFARKYLGQDTLEALGAVADTIAQGIERKRAEEKLFRLNRTLRTLYQCNQALVRATEEYELLRSVCQILVEVGSLRMAWVGYREFNSEKTVRPVSQAGYEDGYLERIKITWADTERGRGPVGTAIRTGATSWNCDILTDPNMAPWRAEALKRGYASCMALPLMSHGEAFGSLALYAEESDAFTQSTIEQYTDLANNLAYGVVALRTREERERAEEALRTSEQRLQEIVDNTTAVVFVKDLQLRYILVNREYERRHGVQRDQIRGKTDFDIHPHDVAEAVRANDRQVIQSGVPIEFEEAVPSGEGERWLISAKFLLRDHSGKPYAVCGIATDITERKRTESEIRQLNASLEKRVVERTIELVRSNEQLKRAEEQVRKRGEQVQKHRDVLLELAHSDKSNLAKALQKICSLSAATLEVARVSYWSLQENDSAIACEVLYLHNSETFDERFKGSRLGFSDCPAYFEALATKRPIVANRVLTNPATCGLAENYLKPLGISSMLDAPVWVRGELVGVLCHEHIGPARDWSAEEIDFVSALAAMVSLALEESKRAQSEHLLRESEEKFRALFEGTSQAVLLHDENEILEANPSWLQLLGYSRLDEAVGKHPADLSAPIQPGGGRAETLAREHIANALANGSTQFEWMTLRRDGTELPMEVFLTRIRLGGRQLIQAVCNDITVRKRAEEELQESEARLRESEARFSTAFRASPALISLLRLSDGKFVEVNDAFARWLGLDRDRIVGHDTKELDVWLDRDERERFQVELRRNGSVHEVERQFRSRRGTIHTIVLSAEIIEINREPHILGFGIDITERKQAEAELLRALAREKELGQLRSNFVSMVSHEYRTPLGIIQSSAEILEDYLEQLEPAERKDHLRSIRKNTRRMAGLMEEVLLMGSFDAGKMEFKPALLELRTFVRRLVDEVLSATNRRCPIELLLGEMPAEIRADERLLQHIFTNLLTNAVKYSDAGQVVRFELGRAGEDILCVIRDQGIGIPEADREWLFNAFHRGHNVGDRPGTGLGLVIVERCVDLHGGEIKVESNSGGGTAVTLRLPMFGPEPLAESDWAGP